MQTTRIQGTRIFGCCSGVLTPPHRSSAWSQLAKAYGTGVVAEPALLKPIIAAAPKDSLTEYHLRMAYTPYASELIGAPPSDEQCAGGWRKMMRLPSFFYPFCLAAVFYSSSISSIHPTYYIPNHSFEFLLTTYLITPFPTRYIPICSFDCLLTTYPMTHSAVLSLLAGRGP